MQILRAANHRTTQWKNGGGLTREVAVFPSDATLDTFEWRVSVAEIHADGPFSIFPGIDRRLAVIEGRMELSSTGQSDMTLTPASEPIALAGEAATSTKIIKGPVLDLNVMVQRGRYRSQLDRIVSVDREARELTALSSIIFALDDMTVEHHAKSGTLHRFDAVRFDGPASIVTAGERASAGYYLLQLNRAFA